MNYTELAKKETVSKVVEALKTMNVESFEVESGRDALEKIKELIPQGVSVMNGSSRTLEQIGFVEYLKAGGHGWNNLHEGILKETDKTKQSALRRQALLSDYYLGSVHALMENGQFIIASNSGSQLPHVVFSSKNLIFVVSTKKIVPTFEEAMNRLEKHIIPLEDENMMTKYKSHTAISKIVIFRRESPTSGRKVTMILVNEDLGF